MPSLKAIRKRIASVKNTKKITAAMKLVAGARLRRAQEAIWAARPYAKRLQDVITDVAARADEWTWQDEIAQPIEPLAEGASDEERQAHDRLRAARLLLHRPEEKRVAFVLLTSDRGLCGAFNSNLCRRTERFLIDNEDEFTSVALNIVGRKGNEYFRRKKYRIAREWPATSGSSQAPDRAREVAHAVTADFLAGEVDAVYLVYNEFKSAISQNVVIEPLLPVTPGRVDETHGRNDFSYEPSVESVLSHLGPLYVEFQVYRALLESNASEFGAKMSAMDAATSNASEMIGDLTLQFNRARQAAITKELMEIIGGAEALKG